MIHPDTEVRFINKEKGYGLVATKLIPQGTITWVQNEIDQIFTEDSIMTLPPLTKDYLETYCFISRYGEKILCGDNGKFVNHSFNPSCFSTAYDFEIAVRDILPGEELTDDYGYLNLEKPFEALDEGSSRKTVNPDDILKFHQEWDKLILENAPKVLMQNQPLLSLIPLKTWREFTNAVHNGFGMKSILECYYDRNKKASGQITRIS